MIILIMESKVIKVLREIGPSNITTLHQQTNIYMKNLRKILINSDSIHIAARAEREFYYITKKQGIQAYRRHYPQRTADLVKNANDIKDSVKPFCTPYEINFCENLLDQCILLYFHVNNKSRVRHSLNALITYFKFLLQQSLQEKGYNQTIMKLLDLYSHIITPSVTEPGGRGPHRRQSIRRYLFRHIRFILDNKDLPPLEETIKIYNAPHIDFWITYYLSKIPLSAQKSAKLKEQITRLKQKGLIHRTNLASSIANILIKNHPYFSLTRKQIANYLPVSDAYAFHSIILFE